MVINPFDFVGPGTLKGVLKGLDAVGVPCKGGVEMLEELTSSPAYMKHRVDEATDKIQEIWDDHKEDVADFFDNVGDTISDGWDAVTENAGDFFEGAVDFIGSLFG